MTGGNGYAARTNHNTEEMMAQIAPIYNLQLVRVAMERVQSRTHGLPGMAVLYGPSGFGKSMAAMAVANDTRAYMIQVKSAWSRKVLLEKVLEAMGIRPLATLARMLDQVCEQLALSGRLLVIDEFDYCCRTDGLIELIRDLHEGSMAAILLVGEELLPKKLQAWERFHGRVLVWQPAAAVTLEDAAQLAAVYAPEVAVGDDLLRRLVAMAQGSVRRVCVNLANINETALTKGWELADLATWGDRPIFTGETPIRNLR